MQPISQRSRGNRQKARSMTNFEILETGVKNVRNVRNYIFGENSINEVQDILEQRRSEKGGGVIAFVDDYFKQNREIIERLGLKDTDLLLFVDTEFEPTTDGVNAFVKQVKKLMPEPVAIIGMGGGIVMDTCKAVANLLTNGGIAEDYQGWDLVKKPAVFKIAIPTISGTGAEATRTCVMTNKVSGLKLGMNSDYTVFDQVIMDPVLTATVPRQQYFYTGMDAYIHSFESMNGHYRNIVGDSFSTQTIELCHDVFLNGDMMTAQSREKLMLASFLGGCAIATGYVGVVHPFSAGLSVVLGTKHCLANCIALTALSRFYPDEFATFNQMMDVQGITLPSVNGKALSDEQHDQLYDATIVHEKPLTNALGRDFRSILDRDTVKSIFKTM